MERTENIERPRDNYIINKAKAYLGTQGVTLDTV
jgi:hypothetical protein